MHRYILRYSFILFGIRNGYFSFAYNRRSTPNLEQELRELWKNGNYIIRNSDVVNPFDHSEKREGEQ